MLSVSIIKAGQSIGSTRVVPAKIDLADHVAEAKRFLEEAQTQAAAIVARARALAERVGATAHEDGLTAGRAEGYEKGHAEGLQAGRVQGHQEALAQAREKFDADQAALAADLHRLVAQLQADHDQWRSVSATHIMEFAIALAKKLTFAIGSLHRECAARSLERAMQLVHDKTRAVVRVNPVDIESLSTFAPSLAARIGCAAGIRLEPDESLAPGGCLIQTERGSVDARLETQFEEVVSFLLSGPAAEGASGDGSSASDSTAPAGEAHD